MKLFGVLLGICFSACSSEEIPDFLHVCSRNDPDLETCLIKSVTGLKPILVKGAPEYNIPSIEPLVINDLVTEKLTDLMLNITNVKAYGCSDFEVRSIKMNLDTFDCNLDIDIPKLSLAANYNIDGKLVMLPIRGKGLFEANISDICAKPILKGRLIEKDGDQYLHYHSVDLNVEIGDGVVKLENVNGDKVLLQIMNDVVNKNLDVFVAELMPPIEKALSELFLNIGNEIVKHFTFDQLFPN